MPSASPSVCAAGGCGKLAASGKRFCPKHAAEAKRRQTLHERQRKRWAFYGTQRWQHERRAFLRLHPLCQHCSTSERPVPALEVDHIKAHKGSSTLFWNWTNWQALCTSCHSRKTNRDLRLEREEALFGGSEPSAPDSALWGAVAGQHVSSGKNALGGAQLEDDATPHPHRDDATRGAVARRRHTISGGGGVETSPVESTVSESAPFAAARRFRPFLLG
jgi:5-methylcytosine-specific restriction enzyme A